MFESIIQKKNSSLYQRKNVLVAGVRSVSHVRHKDPMNTICCVAGDPDSDRTLIRWVKRGKGLSGLIPGLVSIFCNAAQVVLEDIDECTEIAQICEHGSCTNVFGSFICTCDPGYRLDFTKAMCIGKSSSVVARPWSHAVTPLSPKSFAYFIFTDINECIENPGQCGVGECQNYDGGFQCSCPPGYMLLPSGRN